VNFVAIKLLYREVTPAAASVARMVPMWLILVAICLWQKEPLTVPKEDRFKTYFQGFLSLGVYMIFFFEGLARTGGAEGSVLLTTSPIWTALIAMLVRQEEFRPMVLIGAVTAFFGAALVIWGRAVDVQNTAASQEHLFGVGLVLTSALIWAWTTVISKPLLHRISPIRMLAVSAPASLLVLLPYGLVPAMNTQWSAVTPTAWFLLFHITVLAGVVGFIGFYAGVKQVGAPGAMLYQYFVPPLAALLEWAVIGKTLQPIQFLGFGIIVVGVWTASRFRQHRITESN
jgi:drug/metabolite transporter (DMT)-like permease